MKPGLLSLACLLTLAACSRENEPTEAAQAIPSPRAIPTVLTAPPQDASARVDMALMHDYELARDGAAKYQRPFPDLPSMADDAVFLRRACIDLAGRLPKADEVRRFLADTSPDKRATLTDALTREPGAAELRYRMLAEAFRVTDADPAVIAWLRKAALEDRPYAEIITHMIGGGHMSRRDSGDVLHTTVETAYALLGEDFYCAMCHDHPFNDHTQREFFSFAACFAQKDTVRLPADYKYPGNEPGELVPPYLPRLSRGYTPSIQEDQDKLPQVARWITENEDSNRHALVAALRVWKGLFGMPGLMESPGIGGMDEAPRWHGIPPRSPSYYSRSCFGVPLLIQPTWLERQLNSASDFSQAAKVLIEEFRRCGGRIGEFQRILARTNAYWRSGHAPTRAWEGCYLVPAPQIRRLPAELIWSTLTGEMDTQLAEVPPQGHPLRMLGRGTREWADESLTPVSHALVRFVVARAESYSVHASESRTDDLFLTVLGRPPSVDEHAAIVHRQATSQDIAWALLNTAEFMFRP